MVASTDAFLLAVQMSIRLVPLPWKAPPVSTTRNSIFWPYLASSSGMVSTVAMIVAESDVLIDALRGRPPALDQVNVLRP